MMRRIRLWLRQLGAQPSAVPSDVPAPTQPQYTDDRFDSYARGIVGAQATVDIFKGIWSSELPAQLGVIAGGAKLFDDPRLHWMLARLGSIAGWRVLELGPLEGGHSYMLQAAGAEQVLALDACAMSYLKCLVVKDLCKLSRVDFRYGDFMAFMASDTASYDLIVASGVLYHQRDPIACIERMAARSDKVFLWTHYYADDIHSDHLRADMFVHAPAIPRDGFNCDLFRLDYATYLPDTKYRGGVDDHVHWMRREDILACLRHYGYTDIEVAFDQTEHPFGPNFALLAKRPVNGAAHAYRDEMRAMSGPEPWCIDAIRFADGCLEVAGWAIPPAGAAERIGFLVNGLPVTAIERGVVRDDVGAFYWYYPAANHSGYSFRHAVDVACDAALHLQYIDTATGRVIASQHDLHVLPQDLRGETPAPPLALVQRTHTGNAVDQYFVEGYSIYRTVSHHFALATGQPIVSVGRMLDFGCGPGRLTRYFLNEPGLQMWATDIDADCITWCSTHLGAASYFAGSLRPPLSIADGSVGCLLAINVLLHLREEDSLCWLAEWRRICQPGGYVVVTVAADLAMTRANISAEHYAGIKGYGCLILSRNPDLDEVIADREYYQNVFYSHDYLRRVWPTLGFEILRIVPGCIGNHHDLVIMRRIDGVAIQQEG